MLEQHCRGSQALPALLRADYALPALGQQQPRPAQSEEEALLAALLGGRAMMLLLEEYCQVGEVVPDRLERATWACASPCVPSCFWRAGRAGHGAAAGRLQPGRPERPGPFLLSFCHVALVGCRRPAMLLPPPPLLLRSKRSQVVLNGRVSLGEVDSMKGVAEVGPPRGRRRGKAAQTSSCSIIWRAYGSASSLSALVAHATALAPRPLFAWGSALTAPRLP
jgi:hypothetical protein